MEIGLLAKNKLENRIGTARAVSSSDPRLAEYGVTVIPNLSFCNNNKEIITSSGAIKPLMCALKIRTSIAKENDACALLRLSQNEENQIGNRMFWSDSAIDKPPGNWKLPREERPVDDTVFAVLVKESLLPSSSPKGKLLRCSLLKSSNVPPESPVMANLGFCLEKLR